MRKGKYIITGLMGIWLLVSCAVRILYPADELGNPLITNYTSNEYKAHTQNWTIAQDSRGIMYFGNNSGLLEFDGHDWRLIPLPNQSAVRALAIDRKDTIFLGCHGDLGFLVTDAKGERAFQSLKKKLPPGDQDFALVWDCRVTSQGVYFLTDYKIFRWHQGVMSVIPFTGTNGVTLFNDTIFIAGFLKGIGCIRAGQIHLLPLTEMFALQETGNRWVFPHGKDEILIATQKQGFFIYQTGVPPRGISLRKFPTEIDRYIVKNELLSCTIIQPQLYAFATSNGGIILMDEQGKCKRVINESRGLLVNMVYSVFMDRDQNLWAALNTGICHILLHSPLTYFGKLNNMNDSPCVMIRFQGRLYAGNFLSIYYLPEYHLNDENDSHIFLRLKNTSSECLDMIALDNLLLGSGSGKIYQIRGNEAKLLAESDPVMYFGHSQKFPSHVFIGFMNGLGALEIIGSKPGPGSLSATVSGQEDWVQAREIYDGGFSTIKDFIRKIVSDRNGDLWLSTEHNGILYLRFKGKDVRDFQITRYTMRQGLPANPKNTVHYIDGRLLVGTAKGVYQAVIPPGTDFNPRDVCFVPEQTFAKFLQSRPERVTRLARDRRGNYWLALMNGFGVSRLQRDGSYRWDDVPFKLTQEYMENFLVEEDGIVWLSGLQSQKLFRYDMNFRKNYHTPYHTLIRQVQVGKDVIVYNGNPGEPLVKSVVQSLSPGSQNERLSKKIPYRNNSLTFQYSAAFYETAAGNCFSYQLAGYDTDWSGWADKTEKEYTNLLEGNYIFKVRAKNIFNNPGMIAQFSFVILAPWYRSYWSYLTYLLAFVFLVYSLVRFNTHRLQAAKERLEKIVTERTREVVRQRDEILQQKDEISQKNVEITRQKDEIETYAGNLVSANRQLTEAKDALWGEMELAKKIQTVLLPENPQIPGYEIAAFMKPADEVGGDYYDVIGIDRTHWMVIGDVSGHGVPAGLVMMMAQTALHTALDGHAADSPEKILIKVNRILYENIRRLGEEKYMTITLMAVQDDGTIDFSGLHQDIMVYRAGQKRVELVETHGMWLGVLDQVDEMMECHHLTLQPGDVMLLYTDGIPEAMDSAGHLYSENKLAECLTQLGEQSPGDIKNGILKSLDDYKLMDDLTLMVIHRV